MWSTTINSTNEINRHQSENNLLNEKGQETEYVESMVVTRLFLNLRLCVMSILNNLLQQSFQKDNARQV